jgi:hypothetical protein
MARAMNAGARSTAALSGHVPYAAITTSSTDSPIVKSTSGTTTLASGSMIRGK